MSVRNHSIDVRLLESAKRIFLKKGFLGAELKEICDDAGVTTGAVYKRWSGKEELFHALVADTVKDINESIIERSESSCEGKTDEQLITAWTMSYNGIIGWFRFCWEHHDGFTLLARCAAGTRYGNYLHDFCERMTAIDFVWLKEMQDRGLCDNTVDDRELHILLTAYWESYYEPFVHDFTWEEIEHHAMIMCRLFDWKSALGIY